MMRGLTVILANGAFPRAGGVPWRLLEEAARVVACDGAADEFRRRFSRDADFVVGDLDSLRGCPGGKVVRVEDQDTNDLTKAIDFCRGRGWRKLVIVGATGLREDHMLGNVFRAMEAGVEIVSDCGRFIPLAEKDGGYRFRSRVGTGAPLSVFATDPTTVMTSKGLVWRLDGVVFRNLYCATLNRASRSTVEISSNRPAFVYVPHVAS